MLIQQARKKVDNNFNDFVAQLYEQEFKTQEKVKEEHIRKAKEKVIEDEQQAERNRKSNTVDDEQLRQENAGNYLQSQQANVQTPEPTQQTTSSVIGNDWSQVSPDEASQYMSSRTGIPVSTWQAIIYAESTNNPTVINSIGCFGYLQLNPIHGNVSSLTPQQYLDTAVSIYNSQGLSAWQVTTNGMVN